MNASDFTDNSLTGIATVTNGRAIITKTLVNDFSTEGTESFTFNIKTSAIGPIVATSAPITVADTSVPTVTPTTTSLNEGSSVTFDVTSGQLSTTLFWTLNTVSGSITASDFVGLATTGSFTTNGSGVGSTTLTLANDLTTEGTESFQLQVRTGSTSGTISTTSAPITVADTSVPTVTPTTTSLNEGSSVTFDVTSGQLSTTLFWTLNTVSGSITASDFVGLATTGSFTTNGSGVGSTTLTLANDLTTEGTESFQLQVRTGSTSGTISTTSSTITVLDTSIGYVVTSGTKAPVFGANGASPHPPSGWTSQFNGNSDDSSVVIPTLPFNFFINNTAFTAVFLGSNSYITFGSGSSEYSGLSAATPAIPKMMFGAADNSYQRVSTFVSGTDYVRVRYEGNGSTSGTAGSPGIVAEITLFNPSKFSGGSNVIEMLVGVHNRTGGVSNISNASTAYATYTVSANQSYVFVGNSTGTSWTINTGSFVSGTGY